MPDAWIVAARKRLAGVFRDFPDVRIEEEPIFSKVVLLNPSLAFIPDKETALVAVSLPTKVMKFRESKYDRSRTVISEDYQSVRYVLIRQPAKIEDPDLVPILFQKYELKALYSLGIRARPVTIPPRVRMSASLIKQIKEAGGIRCEEIPNPSDVFQAIRKKLTRYHEFPDEQTADFIALWIIGTYFFPLFDAYPYLYIWGMKRVGKSKLLHFVSLLAFNALFSNNLTAAAIFRLVDECQTTLLMDETEDLNDPQRKLDIRSILLAGYKRGSSVYRVEGERRKYVRDFEVYSPKALANINGIEDVLTDRAITVIMRRSIDRTIVDSTIDDEDPEWEDIRNKLYLLALGRWSELYKISKTLVNPSAEKIIAREYELWHSIFSLAKWVSDDLLNTILPWAEGKSEEKEIIELNDNRDLMLLHTLTRHVDKTAEYSAVQIRDWLKGEYPEDEVKEMKWINTNWIGRAIRRLGFLDSRKLSREGGRHFYTVNKDVLDVLAQKARVIIPTNTAIPPLGQPPGPITIDAQGNMVRHPPTTKMMISRPTNGIPVFDGIVPKVGLKEEKGSQEVKDDSTDVKEADSK